MKKQMNHVSKIIWALNGMLAVFCIAVVVYGASFVSHADSVKGTITASNVNVRESASTSATAVATLTTNDLVDVLAETTGNDNMKWYKITTESGVTGYVRADFVTKATVTVDVTATDAKTVYIAGNSANIRQDASTDSPRVANAQGGSKVTIIGEATGTDGKKWYQIEFDANGTKLNGFIRSDLVTTEAPVQTPEVTEIEGEMGEDDDSEVDSSETASDAPVQDPAQPEDTQIPVASDANVLTIMEPVSLIEILPVGFEQTELLLGEDVFTVWGKDHFYIMYASVNGAEPQYYLYDTDSKSYVSYTGLLTEEDVAVSEEEGGLDFKLIAIICIGVIVILVIVIGVLGFKLANAGYVDDEEDDEEDDDIYVDDDEEDYVDLSGDDDVTETIAEPEVTQILPEMTVTEYEVPSGEEFTAYEVPAEEESITYEVPLGETIAYVDVNDEAQMTYETVAEAPVPETTVGMDVNQEETIGQEYVAEENSLYEENAFAANDAESETFFEEDEEAYGKSRKNKKAKKEKKKLSQRFLEYFTVEVEDEEEEDDIYDEEEEDENGEFVDAESDSIENSSKYEDDDDDDDLNFIDL